VRTKFLLCKGGIRPSMFQFVAAACSVVGCKIPRKENSPIFLFFRSPPPLLVSPGSPEFDSMMDQNRRSE